MLDGMNLDDDRALLALQLMVEGNSLRSIQRTTGIDINTLMKLLVRAAEKCEKLMGRLLVNIHVTDVQADEIWSYIGCKEKNKRDNEVSDRGDCYIWVAIERNFKLVLAYTAGRRTGDNAMELMRQINYGKAATSGRLKRVFEVAQLKTR